MHRVWSAGGGRCGALCAVSHLSLSPDKFFSAFRVPKNMAIYEPINSKTINIATSLI